MPAESLTQVVDEDDKPVGVEARWLVQQKGLRHRVVGVWLCDEDTGDILLQKRLSGRGLDDGRLDSSASGHVDPDEDYETTAVRETREELDIHIEKQALEEIAYFRSQATQETKTLNRFTKVFRVKVARKVLENVSIQEAELASTKILSQAEFDGLVQDHPDETVPGVAIAHYIDKGLVIPENIVVENQVMVLT
jgi:isopentenyldiphosphate isomerase